MLVGDSTMSGYFQGLKAAFGPCTEEFQKKVQGTDARYSGFVGSSQHTGAHLVCCGASRSTRGCLEIWYHQLGRVEPPRPRATAAGAEDYYAKDRGDVGDWGGSYGNKEFMKYVHMDVLDFSYRLRGICNRRARSNHTIFP